jgi:hypothetical protein
MLKVSKLDNEDMDVNEHERISNVTLKTQFKVKEWCFYSCSVFYSHSRVFNNVHSSYPTMIVFYRKYCRKRYLTLEVGFFLG